MFNLPTEVTLLILSQLVAREKLECMTVCRQWHGFILDYSLFQVIVIHREQQLQQLIERVSKDPTQGTKVEQLHFQSHFQKDFYSKTIVQLFPNVRHFAIISHKYAKPSGQKNLWYDHIRTVVESGSDLQTKIILGSGLCKKLTSITTTSASDYTNHDLFGLLRNAPTLRKLHLQFYNVSFKDLELLHRNVPLLNSLELEGSTFKDARIPPNIKPATLLKSFRCWDTSFFSDVMNGYLLYTSEKYTHLEEVEFDARALDYVYHDVDEKGTVITKYPRALVKTLGPRLKKLSLFMDNIEVDDLNEFFDFNVLDESECQIDKLDLNCMLFENTFKKLAESKKAQYIKSLSVAQLNSDDRNSISLKKLASFTSLKELTLGTKGLQKLTLNLTDIMGKANESLLECLRLDHFHLELDCSITTLVYPLLRDLTLFNVEFKTGTDTALSRLFPNLKRLKLRGYFGKEGSFKLPSANLSYLEIININVNEGFPILVTTLVDGQQRVYNAATTRYDMRYNNDIPEEDILMFPSVHSIPLDKSKDVPLATIVCNSLSNFALVNSSRDNLFY